MKLSDNDLATYACTDLAAAYTDRQPLEHWVELKSRETEIISQVRGYSKHPEQASKAGLTCCSVEQSYSMFSEHVSAPVRPVTCVVSAVHAQQLLAWLPSIKLV